MRILLDTCSVIWMICAPERLTETEKSLILDESNELYVSVASCWEIEIKRSLGKLKLVADWKDAVESNGCVWLGIKPEHTEILRDLPAIHNDPFDRMLVSQAKYEQLSILTHDVFIKQYDIAVC